jgi:hypothetical protein
MGIDHDQGFPLAYSLDVGVRLIGWDPQFGQLLT